MYYYYYDIDFFLCIKYELKESHKKGGTYIFQGRYKRNKMA